MGETPVRIYLREGCHLCEEALELLARLAPDRRVDTVDIEADPELHRRYLERIPVVEVGGEIVCELICDESDLGAALGPR